MDRGGHGGALPRERRSDTRSRPRRDGGDPCHCGELADSPASTSFTVPGLGGRKLKIFRDGRIVRPLGDLVVDKLPGVGVAVYVVPPPGW